MTNYLEKQTSYGIVSREDQIRFWAKVNKTSSDEDCWPWKTGKKATFRINSKTASSGRLAYELTVGSIGEGLLVSNSCGNLGCLNPRHLVLGAKRCAGIGNVPPEFIPREVSGIVMRPVDQHRFWSSVEIRPSAENCWNWKKATDKDGYGKTYVISKYIRTHRVSYQLHYGPLNDDLFVCHTCDNPRCVNPYHLFKGTNKDNINDMLSKSRQLLGSRNHAATISESTALEIKKKIALGTETHEQIAKEFGCKVHVVDNIASGNTWSHLGSEIDMSNRRKLGNYRLNQVDVIEIKKLLSSGVPKSDLAIRFNVTKSCISRIATGKNWKHVQV